MTQPLIIIIIYNEFRWKYFQPFETFEFSIVQKITTEINIITCLGTIDLIFDFILIDEELLFFLKQAPSAIRINSW